VAVDPAAPLVPADEGRHRRADGPPPGPERWTFAATDGPGGDGGLLTVHLTWFAEPPAVSYAAAVRTGARRAVVLVADDLAPPRAALELRGPGIWADHNVEEPFERWSLGLEAFGVAIDVAPHDDLEVVLAHSGSPDVRGDRVALGWDLEWIAAAAPQLDGPGGYRVPARVEGELLVGTGSAAVDVAGGWAHRW
jgi:hypothetical protein